jgi:chromosome segregation ATPase
MIQIEQNVMNSFRIAKRDIIMLQSELISLRQEHEELLNKLADIEADVASVESKNELANSDADSRLSTVESNSRWLISRLNEQRKAVASHVSHMKAPARRKTYLASKKGKKFHVKNCPFSQNIKPKTKIIFKTKAKAFNKGYKACSCIR